ncbi:class I SAM-dependent methyltransferase [Methanococcoides methylutens]|uniref:class I SAM-dependent methyltransferase n=1 Tax=Methanococcoides methylutens TaxID=2226 RepID=UPI00064E90DB|nr:class I SAM-dependent methyltransferase [Methanococcoides methylutens]
MKNTPVWLFDEMKHVGVDYSAQNVVEDYDNRHQGFRNFKQEATQIYNDLNLSAESIIVDLGCGTGGLSIHLARMCKHVYAVDISKEMLAVLEKKATQKSIKNITTTHAGFLTYDHKGEQADAIISNVALHHLPDFWKQLALCNFYEILKPGGKLFLGDVVFGFQPKEYENEINDWLNNMRNLAGDAMADEAITHVRDEYSTWDWIMWGMLERAGFTVNKKLEVMKNTCAYICTK